MSRTLPHEQFIQVHYFCDTEMNVALWPRVFPNVHISVGGVGKWLSCSDWEYRCVSWISKHKLPCFNEELHRIRDSSDSPEGYGTPIRQRMRRVPRGFEGEEERMRIEGINTSKHLEMFMYTGMAQHTMFMYTGMARHTMFMYTGMARHTCLATYGIVFL